MYICAGGEGTLTAGDQDAADVRVAVQCDQPGSQHLHQITVECIQYFRAIEAENAYAFLFSG